MTSIAIIGGTGPQGRGLAYRFALAGYRVIVGSRSVDRAEAAAAEIAHRLGDPAAASGADNASAAAKGEIVVVAVPFDGYRELLSNLAESIGDKIVVTCVNPLTFDRSGPIGLPVPEGSAAEMAAQLLPRARVTSAFHHVSAVNLWASAQFSGEDILVCGDDKDATARVRELAAAVAGKPGIDAGPLRIARHLEPFTAVLITINKRYKAHSGVSICGIGERPAAGASHTVGDLVADASGDGE